MFRNPITTALRIGAIAAAAGVIAVPVLAQDAPVHWDLKAGFNQPVGATDNILQGGGYAIGAGLSLTPQRGSPFSLRFDFDYAQNNATHQLLNEGAQQGAYAYGGTTSLTSVTANGVYKVPLGGGVRAYGVAGVGAYNARVDFNQGGYGYCNPFWGYCYGYGYGPSDSTTKFGWNAGLGVEFPLYYGQAWFIEARFNRIETQQAIEYVPITVGFRF
jgi:opacity protein-like surface antigen